MTFMLKRMCVIFIGALLSQAIPAYGVPVEVADYTFVYPDPSGRNSEPDPAVWNKQSTGAVSIVPVSDLGLALIDPSNADSLLYTYTIKTAPANIATASITVKVDTPPLPNNSPAWVNNAIGWRMILDDGNHRLELALAYDPATPTLRRVLMVEDTPSVPLIPFPWDNDFFNMYEIGRLADGNFFVTATNDEPMATNNPTVTTYIHAGALPGSSGALFAWGTGLAGGSLSYWQSAHVEVTAVTVPEPSTLLLLGSGLAGLVVLRKRFKG